MIQRCVHSFVLVLPAGEEPPDLPWADELTPDNPRAPRWCRVTNEIHGDGFWFDGEVHAMVVDAKRDVQSVIDSFQRMELHPDLDLNTGGHFHEDATLFVKRAGSLTTEVYSTGASPLLRAAARARGVAS